MALLSRELYKLIEGKLHNRFRMREEVEQYYSAYQEDMVLSRQLRDVAGGGTSYRADMTALTAIKRAQPPKHIREAERWISAIMIVEKRYSETPKGMFVNAYYDGTEKRIGRMLKVCEKLNIEQATGYFWKDEIVGFAALVAANKNMIVIEEKF